MPTQPKQAAQQLAKKLKLEEQFKPHLRRFFKQIAKDVGVTWTAKGALPSMESYRVELVTLLRQHYRRVEKQFAKTMRNNSKTHELFLETKQEATEEETDSQIREAMIAYILAHSTVQAQYILNTTQEELQKIFAKVSMQAAVSEKPQSNVEIGRSIKKEFENKSEGRIKTIALTETQTPAERMKFIEAGILASALALTTEKMTKTWNSAFLPTTRPAHAAAHGQEVRLQDPYLVGGERLLIPGDTSLGASIGNIANCYCSSVISVNTI